MANYNIYEATFLVPNTDLAINALVANVFSCRINSKTGVPLVKYIAQIDNNDTNASVYTSNVTLTAENYVYDGETLYYTVPSNTMVNGTSYKHYITSFDASDLVTGVVSYETLIICNTPATLTFNVPATITSREYTFTFDYSQAQYVPIEYFQLDLYAGGSLEKSSGLIYGGRPSYKFSGFTNSSYQIKVSGKDVNGIVFESELKSFTVSYSQPNISIQPTVTQDSETSLITIALSNIVQITGTATGSVDYPSQMLHIPSTSTVEWALPIPLEFATLVRGIKSSSVQNKIVEHETDDGILYSVGYNGTRFYFVNDVHEVLGQARSLPDGMFKILILPTEVYIITEDSVERISYDNPAYVDDIPVGTPLILLDGVVYDMNNEQIFVLD